MLKVVSKGLMLLVVFLTSALSGSAVIPQVFVNDKLPLPDGRSTKIAYSDIFTTNINGENIKMRVLYFKAEKNVPAVNFEILSTNSNLYKEFHQYAVTLSSVIDKIQYTGKAVCDIVMHEKDLWMLTAKYAVAGSALAFVRATYDDLSKNAEPCIAITFPLAFMDSHKYNWNGKNHHKDLLNVLTSGDCKDIEYSFTNPLTKKKISVTLPLNSDISLVVKKLTEAYK